MKVWKMLVFFWMFLPQSWTSGEDTELAEDCSAQSWRHVTVVCFVFLPFGFFYGHQWMFLCFLVAEDISVHQLERLVELLTFKECKDLLVALSNPEENIFQHLHLLSPENNPLDDETQCRTALTGWIVENGERTYYDRLSRALQHIGRTDIAIEVGKNINQDKALSLKRYVEDYHKYVMSLNLPSVREATRTHQRAHQRASNRAGNDLPGPDLVQQGLSAVVVPFLYGALLAIGVTLLAAFLFFIILKRPERSRCLPAIWKKGQS
ncbi:hypothetical protein FQA47_007137 [Oryzias melastigma]|uniref:Death domain-containing protein n=1 Tax=Oryzias melastigma TaxID=30732 RepID=A0A834BWM0_ORYME|nr:hypothetical protein FQA47_007137 [Oryzias melastigma]